ncbi:MAG: hypothetical protein M0C28_44010 [Candidatus Moduliflexus flocculans]|nr:hypothetical protein [Candidatus Moduliflexus flocculans]
MDYSTRTTVSFQPSLPFDELIINGREVMGAGRDRVSYILDIIRGMANIHERAEVMTENNFPSARGSPPRRPRLRRWHWREARLRD